MADAGPAAETAPACRTVQSGPAFVGKQGLSYAPAISAETVGARGIHMQMVTFPPGGRAKAHRHADHETAIYILSGESGMYWGERLEHYMVSRAGDYVYIPAGMPHLPFNTSDSVPVVAIIARTDPHDQEGVELLPHLEPAAAAPV